MRIKRTKAQIEFDIENKSKICNKCGERIEFDYFKNKSKNIDGKYNTCKYCASTATKIKMRFSNQKQDDIRTQTKICTTCGIRKPFEEFSKYFRKNSDGRRNQCKLCDSKWKALNRDRQQTLTRVSMMLKKYGLDEASLRDMMDKQNGCCAICEESLVTYDSKQTFHIDHCHNTNVVRGLLCNSCNLMLGSAKDSPSILRKGIEYLLEKGYYGKD